MPATGWESVTAAGGDVCVLRDDGQAWCWNAATPPSRVAGPAFTAVSIGPPRPCAEGDAATCRPGDGHLCLLDTGGGAHCQGRNDAGQLGDGSTEDRAIPVPLGGRRFRSVGAGAAFTCAVSIEDAAFCWGANDQGMLGIGRRDTGAHPTPLPVGRPVRAVVAATAFACALDAEGQAWCWGADRRGRLGSDAAPAAGADAPVPVNGAWRFQALSAGPEHVCGLTRGGRAVCWGDNTSGQLGGRAGTRSWSRDPVAAGGPAFVAITAGRAHSCGLGADGSAWCWGRLPRGRRGPPPNASCLAGPCVDAPVEIDAGTRFRSLAAGDDFTCGVSVGRRLRCSRRTAAPFGCGVFRSLASRTSPAWRP